MIKIHHLIAFPTEYIELTQKIKDIEASKDRDAWKEFINSMEYHRLLMGGKYRGSYTDKQKLIDRIKASTDVYDICEGWYDYLLIESYHTDCIDGMLFDAPEFTESEMWFKFVKINDDQYEYQQIERPECFLGTCCFL
jgi:hypothetical protein